jgi:serine O-acetyltransferase
MELNLEIPLNVFGPGLTVVHYGNIVVNPKVRAGRNCRIHPGSCLGEWKDGNPVFGDDVYIGNGALIIGDITIGDRAKIGPHALVRHSVEVGGVVVSEQATRPGSKLINSVF